MDAQCVDKVHLPRVTTPTVIILLRFPSTTAAGWRWNHLPASYQPGWERGGATEPSTEANIQLLVRRLAAQSGWLLYPNDLFSWCDRANFMNWALGYGSPVLTCALVINNRGEKGRWQESPAICLAIVSLERYELRATSEVVP